MDDKKYQQHPKLENLYMKIWVKPSSIVLQY